MTAIEVRYIYTSVGNARRSEKEDSTEGDLGKSAAAETSSEGARS